LVREGFDRGAIAKITALPESKVKSTLTGKTKLTDRHFNSIEQATGKSVGQLAALHIEPHR
jgi:hypothetical protein